VRPAGRPGVVYFPGNRVEYRQMTGVIASAGKHNICEVVSPAYSRIRVRRQGYALRGRGCYRVLGKEWPRSLPYG
jgi:hypothetical protein